MFERQRWSLYLIIIICSCAAYFAYNKMMNSKKAQVAFSQDHSFAMVYRAQDDDAEKSERNTVSRLHAVAVSRNGIPSDGINMYYINGETLKSDFIEKEKQYSKNDFRTAAMAPGSADYFIATLPAMERGKKYYYFIEAKDNAGNVITMPPDPIKDFRNLYRITYENKEHLNQPLLLIHIVTMLIALFFLIHSFYYSLHFLIVGAKAIISKCFSTVFWGNLFFFLSGFPIGCWVAYDSVGSPWGGFPLGNDITDNKTLVTFVFWTIILLLMPKTLLKKETGRDFIGEKTFAVLTILGSILTLVVFLVIPHSY